ncbi:MAG: hypothetical protein Q4B64_09050 [Spirochaetales bacterium]|nr:hypothetical protein [Spirochaetales bacterium]
MNIILQQPLYQLLIMGNLYIIFLDLRGEPGVAGWRLKPAEGVATDEVGAQGKAFPSIFENKFISIQIFSKQPLYIVYKI